MDTGAAGDRGEGRRVVKIVAAAVLADGKAARGWYGQARQFGCKSDWLTALGTNRQLKNVAKRHWADAGRLGSPGKPAE